MENTFRKLLETPENKTSELHMKPIVLQVSSISNEMEQKVHDLLGLPYIEYRPF